MNKTQFAGWVALGMFLISGGAFAKSSVDGFPAPAKGGVFKDAISGNPFTLNPILYSVSEDRDLFSSMFMTLYYIDEQTYEYVPALAEKFKVSKDKKEYTFTLNKNAKWSDGTSVTSDDFEFTYQKIMDPKAQTALIRSYFVDTSFEKIDSLNFKLKTKNPRFNTFNVFVVELYPIQKKQFENEADFPNSKKNLSPIGNGPYKFKSFSRDQSVVLERDPNWWAKDLPQYKPTANFDILHYKIIADPTLVYENFLKGQIDMTTVNAEKFETMVKGIDKDKFDSEPGGKKSFWAKRFTTDLPLNWTGLSVNLKNPVLASVKVRQAMAYLIDYQAILTKILYNGAEQALGPFGSRTDFVPPELKSGEKKYKLDVKKALALLKEDGWADTDQNAVQDKMINGKKTELKFTLKLPSSPMSLKLAQVLKENFRKAAIDLSIQAMDPSAYHKSMENRDYELGFMGWGTTDLFEDPRQLWHSESAKNGGSNAPSYSSAKVDQLIEKANLELDKKKRAKLLQEIVRELYNDLPYIFLTERRYINQLFNSKLKSPVWIQKYSGGVSRQLFHF
jgi:ABC-type transport system substrate-binding protein